MDQIDRMIMTEVLQIRKATNEARKKLNLPQRDYTGIPIDASAELPEPNSNQ